MQQLKIERWTSCELDTKPNRSLTIWERQENSTSSAKHQNVQFENWEILNCMSWEMCPTKRNASAKQFMAGQKNIVRTIKV